MKRNLFHIWSLSSLVLLLKVSQLWAGNFTGQIYELRADPKTDKPIYKMKHEEKSEGDLLNFHNVYAYPNDKDAVIEDVVLKDGTKLVSYHHQQKQLQTDAMIEVKADKILFSFTKKDHKEEKAEEKYQDNTVVGPSLVPYMQKNWDDLSAGKTVKVRLAVPDRRETVGFDLKKHDSSTEEKLAVKMAATNFAISMLVDPLYFYFDSKTKKLVEMKGRTQTKREENGRFKDLDAFTVYTYE